MRRRWVLGVSLVVAVVFGMVAMAGFSEEADAIESVPDDESRLAMFDPARGEWHIRYADGAVDSFFYGAPGDLPLLGDWDCDGVDTVAMFRPSNGFIYLRNSNSFGVADRDFFYGIGGDIPLAGDWNGDGCDTFSIYRPSEGKVYVSNRLGTAPAEFSFFYGIPGDKPFAGDFDADGVTSVGLYRDTTGFVYFRNPLSTGVAEFEFFYGVPSDRIVAGDWDADGDDTVGIFRPESRRLFLSNANKQGFADIEFDFGQSSWLPVAGKVGTPDNPGDIRNCGDFATQSDAQAWFDLYFPFWGDVANLDGDRDGRACETYPYVTVTSSTSTTTTMATTTSTSTTTTSTTTTSTSSTTSSTTTTTTIPPNPGDTKNCSDFATQAEAQQWFDTYYPYYGDVANLDADGDLIPCESLP